MGSPVSPIVANLFMEHFEQQALQTALVRPRLWKRYVDDTFTICKKDQVTTFIDHINGVDECIKFTSELETEGGEIAFLDSLVKHMPDGSLRLSVYRKPTHTNQYLNFLSHHPLHQKLGVIRTLNHRCETIVTSEEDRTKEKGLLKDALKKCGYPDWAFRERKRTEANTGQETGGGEKDRKHLVVLPYAQGVSEKLCRVFKKHNTNVAFKPERTIRNMLVAPKDKPPRDSACGVVYKIECGGCDSEYIGETGRQLGTRLKEHRKSLATGTLASAVSEHSMREGHPIDWDSVKIIDRESVDIPRKVREAIHIRRRQPQMNRDGGLELPRVYDCVIQPVLPPSGAVHD